MQKNENTVKAVNRNVRSSPRKINNLLNKDAYITHKLENTYFFPIQDKKIAVAKIGKDFSWFSFVTSFR